MLVSKRFAVQAHRGFLLIDAYERENNHQSHRNSTRLLLIELMLEKHAASSMKVGLYLDMHDVLKEIQMQQSSEIGASDIY